MAHYFIRNALVGPKAEMPSADNPQGAATEPAVGMYLCSDTREIFLSTGKAWINVDTIQAGASYPGVTGDGLTPGGLAIAGGVSTGLVTQTIDYAVALGDSIIIVNAANLTMTLPDATAMPTGRMYTIKNGAAASSTTVAAVSGTIDGAATDTTLVGAYAAAMYVSDGSNWFVL